MSMRQPMRIVVALAAAYAVALQTILLAIGGPVAGASEFAALRNCSSLAAGHAAPPGHAGGCLAGCVGCCCAPLGTPVPPVSVICAPRPAHAIAVALLTPPLLLFGPTGAHRSRAPPLARASSKQRQELAALASPRHGANP